MEQKKYRIGILGATGYTGAEILRLMARHPLFELAFASSERAMTNMNPPPPAPHKLTAEIHGAIRAMISSTSGFVLPGSSAFLESQ